MGKAVTQNNLQPGDVIYRDNKVFELANHYGVYIGDEGVIHFSQDGIKLMSYDEFASGYEVSLKRYDATHPREQIVEVARYYLKHPEEWDDYSLVFNNCEHFASFCATGKKKSGQVQKAVVAGAVGVDVGAVLTVVAGGLFIAANGKEDNDKNEEKYV
ncbi:NC domain protein [Oopsacas minuta]|uniref:NC domain protein n=1 Tax=Oopsacas minuta TaxID=111878 RepID=A0AAV7KAN2_9METZ|nr:NC domain protein [Oopsacas minuta]